MANKIINFGSLNIDHVYTVAEFVRPGETIACKEYKQFCGGKGLNQSIALARAGAPVSHAGKIGTDGLWLKELLDKDGTDTTQLQVIDAPTGHAIIQVDSKGENCIVLYGGANRSITPADVSAALENFSEGDILLTQNEVTSVPEMFREADKRGMTIVFNPAPMTDEVREYPLELVDYLVLNEVEGAALVDTDAPRDIMRALKERYPRAQVILTIGGDGALFYQDKEIVHVPTEKVKVVDTTAAGDTFMGYFLASLVAGASLRDAVQSGCKAGAKCVTKPGAADSIPYKSEVR
ncbi:MAG: ribokinase [Deltaproteobacteria bacterium]|nr:ribokinase [Deltaproteobacteria bacterium]